ncbi:TPA_asm: hypothetical protein G0B48_14715 [Salmonella enterica subsp. indica]|uniref:Uncharacterized protein n=1 Tax=Salmonella enterica TaxID=28901 RepID=A0A701YXS6_SALER|nr:hypothetical protein [Salmonella enterica subsp. indica]
MQDNGAVYGDGLKGGQSESSCTTHQNTFLECLIESRKAKKPYHCQQDTVFFRLYASSRILGNLEQMGHRSGWW